MKRHVDTSLINRHVATSLVNRALAHAVACYRPQPLPLDTLRLPLDTLTRWQARQCACTLCDCTAASCLGCIAHSSALTTKISHVVAHPPQHTHTQTQTQAQIGTNAERDTKEETMMETETETERKTKTKIETETERERERKKEREALSLFLSRARAPLSPLASRRSLSLPPLTPAHTPLDDGYKDRDALDCHPLDACMHTCAHTSMHAHIYIHKFVYIHTHTHAWRQNSHTHTTAPQDRYEIHVYRRVKYTTHVYTHA